MSKAVFRSGNTITYMELHAVVLGLVVGGLVAYTYGLGHTTVAVAGGVVFVGLALGVYARGSLSKAQLTLRREPWYALAAFVIGAAVGAVI